jgi:hypothetical protein
VGVAWWVASTLVPVESDLFVLVCFVSGLSLQITAIKKCFFLLTFWQMKKQ